MASSSAGKSLVEVDCTQHNPLVDLARKVVNKNLAAAATANDDDFEETWEQFLTSSNSLRPPELHDEYLAQLTMSTEAPKTMNLHELADEIEIDFAQNLAEQWAEEYTSGQAANDDLPKHWAEEFSRLELHDQKANEDKSQKKAVSEMWATEFLDKFDQSSRWAEEYLSEERDHVTVAESNAETDEFANKRKTFDVSEYYIFARNNPYLQEMGAFERGQQALNDGLLADAILYFEAAVQQNEENHEGWFQLGECQTQNENDKQAIAAYKRTLKLHPEQRDAMFALAIAYFNESMNSEAYEALDQWFMSYQLGKDSVPFEHNTGPVDPFEDLNVRAEKMEQLIRQVLAREEEEEEGEETNKSMFHNALNVIYNIKGDYDKAAEEVKCAIVSNPKDYVLWNRLGATLANGKRIPEAIAAYREALEICPSYTRARYNLGIACVHLQNYKEAIEHFITALQLQQYCGSISSSTIWTSLRAAVVRSYLPNTLDLLTAVNGHDLEKCASLIH